MGLTAWRKPARMSDAQVVGRSKVEPTPQEHLALCVFTDFGEHGSHPGWDWVPARQYG